MPRVESKQQLIGSTLCGVQLARLRKYLDYDEFHELVDGAFVRVLAGSRTKVNKCIKNKKFTFKIMLE